MWLGSSATPTLPTSRRRGIAEIRLLACAALLLAAAPARADLLDLRNGDLIEQKVAGFDFDGVRVRGRAAPVSWAEIKGGSLDDPAQDKLFQAYVKNLADPLFRIQSGLSRGDFANLNQYAEKIARFYTGRYSDTAYMVMQALMWSRLARGERAAALEPYFHCWEYLKRRNGVARALPGNRRLKVDLVTGMTAELQPVWFDAKAAANAEEPVRKAIATVLAEAKKQGRVLPDGAKIYYGTLALAGGKTETGLAVLNQIPATQGPLAELREIALAQHDFETGSPEKAAARLEKLLPTISAQNKPLALYWLGMAKTAMKTGAAKREGVWRLLHIPALYKSQARDLAGAALYRAIQIYDGLGEQDAVSALRTELLEEFGPTVHARRVAAELNPSAGMSPEDEMKTAAPK